MQCNGVIHLQPFLWTTTLQRREKKQKFINFTTELFDKAGLIWITYKRTAKTLTFIVTVKVKPDVNPKADVKPNP